MNRIIFTIAVFVLFTYTTKAEKERRYIEVNGVSEMKIVPNEIHLSITLNEADKKDRISLKNQEQDLVDIIRSLHIPTENLSIAGANSKLEKAFWKKTRIYSRKNYILKVTKASVIGPLLEKLEDKQISNVHILNSSHSDMDKFRKEVKIMAMKAAKEKADYLLEAIGERTGKPIFIQERNNYTPPMYQNVAFSMNRKESGASKKYNLDFQEMKLKYEIFARFEIVE